MLDNTFVTKYYSLPIASYRADYLCDGNNASEMIIHTTLHNHKELEILCVLSGRASMYIDGRLYEINKGDILIINPMEAHFGEYPTDQEEFSYFCIDFDTELIKTPEGKNQVESIETGELKFINLILSGTPENTHLKTLLLSIYGDIEEKRPGWEYSVRGNLYMLVSVLINNGMLCEINGNRASKKTAFIKSVLEYIEEHYSEPISSGDLAKELSYNQCYFCRSFKQSFGKSFNSYLNTYRACKARELLEASHMSVTEISAVVGFCSNSYFTRIFKNHIGLLPSEYRKSFNCRKKTLDIIGIKLYHTIVKAVRRTVAF